MIVDYVDKITTISNMFNFEFYVKVALEDPAMKFKRDQAARVRYQHKLLLHTYKCQKNKKESIQANGQAWRCHVKGCQKMIGILNHMMSCPADRKCSWPTGCLSLRNMMRHYSRCTKEYCPVCVQKKEWQMSIPKEQRNQIIDVMLPMIPRSHSFIAAWFAMPGHSTVPDESYVRFVERVAYVSAENRDDYFRMMAAKKWEIEMDILDLEQERTRRQIYLD